MKVYQILSQRHHTLLLVIGRHKQKNSHMANRYQRSITGKMQIGTGENLLQEEKVDRISDVSDHLKRKFRQLGKSLVLFVNSENLANNKIVQAEKMNLPAKEK